MNQTNKRLETDLVSNACCAWRARL